MSTATVSYKLLKKIKDDKFNVDDLHHYMLSIQIGTRDFQMLVTDTRDQRVLLLEDFILSSIGTFKDLTETLEDIFDDHHLLKAGFWKKIRVAFKNTKFALVPAPLFDKNSLYDYVKINANVNPERETLLYYKHLQTDAVNVFAVNNTLYNWLTSTYSSKHIECVHQSSNIIEGVLSQVKHHQENNIFLYVDRFKLHVVATKDRKLQYYNQFSIKQFADYIKYIMTAMKGLGHDQRKTQVVLWGYIGKQSPHFVEFSKYIQNLSFGNRPDFLKFGYFFDEVQDHHFFDLYGLNICE